MLICSQIHKQMMKRTSFQWADALPPTISKREDEVGDACNERRIVFSTGMRNEVQEGG